MKDSNNNKRGFKASLLQFFWILISPITFGILVPVLFAYFVSNEPFTCGFIYIAYGSIWFYINEKYII